MSEPPDFDEWVSTVRDPASKASEGKRTISGKKGLAEAGYEVAPLPDGRWAIKLWCRNQDLGLGCMSTPWRAFPSREDCLRHFVEAATTFFSGSERMGGAQRSARAQILEVLAGGGLFGFQEPDPES